MSAIAAVACDATWGASDADVRMSRTGECRRERGGERPEGSGMRAHRQRVPEHHPNASSVDRRWCGGWAGRGEVARALVGAEELDNRRDRVSMMSRRQRGAERVLSSVLTPNSRCRLFILFRHDNSAGRLAIPADFSRGLVARATAVRDGSRRCRAIAVFGVGRRAILTIRDATPRASSRTLSGALAVGHSSTSRFSLGRGTTPSTDAVTRTASRRGAS